MADNDKVLKALQELNAKVTNINNAPKKEKKQKPYRGYDEYERLFVETLGATKLDIFSTKVVYFDDRAHRWRPINDKGIKHYLKSKCHQLAPDGFNARLIDDYLLGEFTQTDPKTRQRRMLTPCFEVPEWDGQDWALHYSQALKVINMAQEHFDNFFKYWLTQILARIINPEVRNRALIINGPQNCGKDTWVRTIFRGFGQFVIPFVLQNQERDIWDTLRSGAIMHVAEFDRLPMADQAKLKNLITAPLAFYRSAFGSEPDYQDMRCTWVATTNRDDILRDPTGGTRFAVFKISEIDWNYDLTQSAQLLAQARELRKAGYQPPQEAWDAIGEYIRSQTPEDPEQFLMEIFFEKVRALDLEREAGGRNKDGTYSYSSIEPVLKEMARDYDAPIRWMQNILKNHKCYDRDKNKRWYIIPDAPLIDGPLGGDGSDGEISGNDRFIQGNLVDEANI